MSNPPRQSPMSPTLEEQLQQLQLQEGNVAKRNTNLDEISNAVIADDDETFERTTFGLKRTQSMGILDSFRPQTDLVGTQSDYPHLQSSNAAFALPPSAAAQPTDGATAFANTDVPNNSNNQLYQHQPPPITPHNDENTEFYDRYQDHTYGDDYDYDSDSSGSGVLMPGSPDAVTLNDDSAVKHEPSRHVDYLSHDWKESDISASWRYIVLRRKDVANSARLENASWRTWTKAKYNLPTVSPESVNWLKDYDVTWLYGPLYEEPAQSYTLSGGATPLSPTLYDPAEHQKSAGLQEAQATAAALAKKPILKKKSASQKILEGPGPSNEADFYFRQHNYRHRAPVIPDVRSRVNQQYQNLAHESEEESVHDTPERSATPDYEPEVMPANSEEAQQPLGATISRTATPQTPEVAATTAAQQPVERHIHFNDRVEQCRVLPYPDTSEEDLNERDYDESSEEEEDDEDEEDDEAGLFLMVRSTSSVSLPTLKSLKPLKGIEVLPATTLKYDIDDTEREARQQAAANSVAYAMSHNTVNRRHGYKTYDYSSVYESPDPSPSQSPRSGSYDSFSMASPNTNTSMTAPIAQTINETALGHFSNGLGDSLGTSEFVEDTSVENSPAISPSASSSAISKISSEVLATDSNSPNNTPPSSVSIPDGYDEDGSPDESKKKLSRINSAVDAAKDIASSLWHGGWKK